MKSKRRLDLGEEQWELWQKKRRSKKIIAYRQRRKKKLIAYKGGRCMECGYNKDCPRAFAFHHRDPLQKKFQLGNHFLSKAWETLLAEADKCDLLCCRCHAELHDELDIGLTPDV